MVRALCIEYPDDAGAWLIDNEYLFGQDMLVAPMFEKGTSRDVYLPGNGKWIDYQSSKTYNAGWNVIEAGEIPAVILVRDGAIIPHIALAQSTDKMDWSKIELKVYSSGNTANGFVCLPTENISREISLTKNGGKFVLKNNPLEGKVGFLVK
jgi:alpha-D-xyloside xylohydrolase